jgi:class 3 adenylate cyclase
MDVGVWLRSPGLGQYEATFRDKEIDGAVLPRLTVDDLKDLGVAVVSHRRKIMSAIEELNAASATRADAIKQPQAHAPPSFGPSSGGAERRYLTAMFRDLVGSTSLAAKLDAEDWRTLVNTYLDEASVAMTGLGGRVAKRLGDGIMALFGHPIAQETTPSAPFALHSRSCARSPAISGVEGQAAGVGPIEQDAVPIHPPVRY